MTRTYRLLAWMLDGLRWMRREYVMFRCCIAHDRVLLRKMYESPAALEAEVKAHLAGGCERCRHHFGHIYA